MSCWERIIQTKSHEPVKSLGKNIMKLNPKIGLEVPGKNLFVPEKGQGKMIDYLKEYLPLCNYCIAPALRFLLEN